MSQVRTGSQYPMLAVSHDKLMCMSLLSGSIHSCTKKRIAAILFSPKEKITLNFQLFIQHGGNNCNLFALVFATST